MFATGNQYIPHLKWLTLRNFKCWHKLVGFPVHIKTIGYVLAQLSNLVLLPQKGQVVLTVLFTVMQYSCSNYIMITVSCACEITKDRKEHSTAM